MQWARGKYSTIISGAIIGFIGFVFVVSGVFNPKNTRGLHEGAVAGTVNGDPISIAEFNRSLNQRMEFFKNMGGGKLTDEQLKAFRLREGVFQELVRRKLMEQEAGKQGLEASDEEVKERIKEIAAFQKDGKFDVATYKQVLEANQYTAGSFERMMRSDLSTQAWQTYFQRRVKVSEGELKRQFEMNEDKRDVRYVLITPEMGRKDIKVEQAEIDKYLADTAKLNTVKSQYEGKKNQPDYKGMTFDMVKGQLAKDLIASEKLDEIKKNSDRLADQVLAVMTGDKSSDAKVNALLKPYKGDVKATGLVGADTRFLPGLGDSPEIIKDAFAAKSPIDPAQGGKPKKYTVANGTVIAVVSQVKRPDLAKFDGARGDLLKQIIGRKQKELYDEWLKKLQAKAKIDGNPAVVGENAEG